MISQSPLVSSICLLSRGSFAISSSNRPPVNMSRCEQEDRALITLHLSLCAAHYLCVLLNILRAMKEHFKSFRTVWKLEEELTFFHLSIIIPLHCLIFATTLFFLFIYKILVCKYPKVTTNISYAERLTNVTK